jgi:hypothetical protein
MPNTSRTAVSMHATTIFCAIRFPDWNSLDSVRHTHSGLEAAALVFFALLVVCEALAQLSDDKKIERRFDKVGIVFFAIAVLAEIAAYPYGQRNDTLSGQVIVSLDAKSKEALANASSALTKSDAAEKKADGAKEAAGEAHDRVRDVGNRADKLEARLAWRTLTPRQQEFIATKLRSLAPQDVDIVLLGTENPEINNLGDVLLKTLKNAWGEHVKLKPKIGLNGTGVDAGCREGGNEECAEAVKFIAASLSRYGIVAKRVSDFDSDTLLSKIQSEPFSAEMKGAIRILVGTKP